MFTNTSFYALTFFLQFFSTKEDLNATSKWLEWETEKKKYLFMIEQKSEINLNCFPAHKCTLKTSLSHWHYLFLAFFI